MSRGRIRAGEVEEATWLRDDTGGRVRDVGSDVRLAEVARSREDSSLTPASAWPPLSSDGCSSRSSLSSLVWPSSPPSAGSGSNVRTAASRSGGRTAVSLCLTTTRSPSSLALPKYVAVQVRTLGAWLYGDAQDCCTEYHHVVYARLSMSLLSQMTHTTDGAKAILSVAP